MFDLNTLRIFIFQQFYLYNHLQTQMGFNKMFLQKLIYVSLLALINVTLISICYTHPKYWYFAQIPIFIVFIFTVTSVVVIIVRSISKKDKRLPKEQMRSMNICYFIPCYNESEEEINNTMESFINQSDLENHKKVYVVVCDGRKQGAGNSFSTDKILSKIIFPNSNSIMLPTGYRNDKKQYNEIQILLGQTKDNYPYFVIIKGQNEGKRDSIGIIRRLCLNFNRQEPEHSFVSQQMLNLFKSHLEKYNVTTIDHIVGVDADTVFQKECTMQLLREVQSDQSILASTGLVKVQFTADTIVGRLMEGFQHVEYIIGQGLLRNLQNLTQQKISCLPGCLNILKVCEQTCGEKLLSVYMKPPTQSDNIFQWIRGSASEDRHSVMLLLELYGDCHTTCTWDAQAVTSVPITPSVFLSQRKRWSLGSATHGLWMVFMDNIPMFQRLSSTVFVLTYALIPYFMYSLISWINAISRGGMGTIFWIMTAIIQIVVLYKVSLGFWLKLTIKERILYFISIPLFYIVGSIVGLSVWCYSLYHMDDFGWGKTRTVIQSPMDVEKQMGLEAMEIYENEDFSAIKNYSYKNQVSILDINMNDQVVQQRFQDSSLIQTRDYEVAWRPLTNFGTPSINQLSSKRSLDDKMFNTTSLNSSPRVQFFSRQPSIQNIDISILSNDMIKSEASTMMSTISDQGRRQQIFFNQEMKTIVFDNGSQKIKLPQYYD